MWGGVAGRSDLAKAAAQVGDDGGGVVKPLALAVGVGDFEAGHFDGAAALHQFGAVGGVVLGVAVFNGQRQAAHFLAHFDAKRAGVELVEREVSALQVDCGLHGGVAHQATRLGEALFEQHERPEHGAQGFEEETDGGFHGAVAIKRCGGR